MGFFDKIGRAGEALSGAAKQVVNEVAGRVPIPIGPLPKVPVGDVLEPSGDAARRAADAVERLFNPHRGDPRTSGPDALRAVRPLLANTSVQSVGGDSVTELVFGAAAPGADWSAPGRGAAMVAVYVDQRYHSTVLVMAERSGDYRVNLGVLPAGSHAVELRAATDLVAPQAPVARIAAVTGRSITGEAALIERHSPILELRDVDRGAAHSIVSSDAPLLLLPAVTRNSDGSRTIEYRVIFSNEDGGTNVRNLYARNGRGVDVEPVYRVTLDASGVVLDERYQATLHRWTRYDGIHAASRPVLRISTANNLVSARTGSGLAERWSDASLPSVDGSETEFAAMRAHSWTWTVMAKELLREGKAAAGDVARGAQQIGDPRRYLYLGPLTDAVRAAMTLAGGIDVLLADGRKVLARTVAEFAASPNRQAALELPPGIAADVVRGVAMLGVQAIVLDETFEMRELAAAA